MLTMWKNGIICSLLLFYSLIQDYMFSSFNKEFISFMSVTPFHFSFISSLYWYAVAFSLIPAGILFDRYNPRKILILAVCISLVASFVLLFPNFPIVFIINRILNGAANALIFIGGLRIVQGCYSKHKTFSTGAFIVIGNLGGIMATGPYIYIKEMLGINFVLSINFLFCFGIFLFTVFYLRGREVENLNTDSPYITIKEHIAATLKSIKEVCLNVSNIACGLYIGIMATVDSIFAALWGVVYLTQKYTFSDEQAGMIISFYIIGMTIGTPLLGSWIDKKNSIRPFLFMASMLSGLLMLSICYFAVFSFKTMMSIFMFLGLCNGAATLVFSVVENINSKVNVSIALAMITLMMNLIAAASQVIYGWLLNRYWDKNILNGIPIYNIQALDSSMLMLPIILFLSILMVYFIRNIKKYSVLNYEI